MGDAAKSVRTSSERSDFNTIAKDVASDNPIQRLYEAANRVVDVSPAALDESAKDGTLAECMSLMEEVTLEQLGFTTEEVYAADTMLSMNVVETERFHIAVFLLPAGGVIPLHDHPNMAVCSKIICGGLKVQSYSQVFEKSITERFGPEDIVVRSHTEFTKSVTDPAWMLTPSVANMHRFEATAPCVILDLLLPPYSEPGRPCTFYNIKNTEIAPPMDSEILLLSAIPEEVADETIELPETMDYNGIVPVVRS